MSGSERCEEARSLLDDIETEGMNSKLSQWENELVEGMLERADKYESDMLVSPRQLEKLREIHDKACN